MWDYLSRWQLKVTNTKKKHSIQSYVFFFSTLGLAFSLCFFVFGTEKLESMDSNRFVSLSSTPRDSALLAKAQQQPNNLSTPSPSLSGSLPIRAPLTVDDDVGSDFESDGDKFDKNYGSSINGSDSGSESEVFVSGEESETASERQLVADSVAETVGVSGVVEKFELSRPSVRYPDEESSENSVGGEEESGEVDGYKPAVRPVMVDELSLKLVRPIAQLSLEEDDNVLTSDEEVVSEVEDGGSLEKVSIAPRIKVLRVDEGEEDETVVGETNDDSLSDDSLGDENGILGVNKEKLLGVGDYVKDVKEQRTGILDVNEEKLLGVGDYVEDVKEQRTEPDVKVENSVEEKQKLAETVEDAIELNFMDSHNPTSLRQSLGVSEGIDDVLKRTSVFSDSELLKEQNGVMYDDHEVFHEPMTSMVKETKESNSMGTNVDGWEVKYVAEETVVCANGVSSNIEFSGGVDNGVLTKTSDSDRDSLENSLNCDYGSAKQCSDLAHKGNIDAELEEDHGVDAIEEEQDGLVSDENTEDFIDISETTKQIINDLGQRLVSSSLFGTQDSEDHLKPVDGQNMDLDNVEIDQDSRGNKLFDSTSLLALLEAATSIVESRGFALDSPAELGSFPHSMRPAPLLGESEDKLSEEDKRKNEKMQLLELKFLRLVHRLGLSPEDSIVSQVLCKLVSTAGRCSSQLCSLESAERMALDLEAENKINLDFCLNILVIGKTGVGKSATINSIFGEKKVKIDAFQPATTTVKEIVGKINGVKIRIIDTPGLKSSAVEQAVNRKILAAISKCIKKFPPDVVLYVDRLDTQTRSINDLPLLRTITESLSSSIWRNAVVTLTHAASFLPDGPSGFPINYGVFVAQRSRVVLQSIGLAVGDLQWMNPNVVQPVSLIENHPLHGKGKNGERDVSDGVSGSSQLLLSCYSIKILSEASSISKPQDSSNLKKASGFRLRSLPLPYLLTSLMQSRVHPKLSADQGGNNIDSDIELQDVSDADSEDEDEYDQLPPFRPLRRSQIAKLSKEQKKAYIDEYDYRVKLLQKKQWREGTKRLKEIKDKSKDASDVYGLNKEDEEKEESGPEDESVALLDVPLPPSFDGDNPAYRYRFLEPTSQLLMRPVVDNNGWDHDCGYDGVSIDRNLAVGGQFPAVFAIQITKDKQQFNIHWDSSVSVKHGDNGSTMAGLDIQTVGKQLAYILRGETKVKNFKINRTTAGINVTFLGEQIAPGLVIGDQVAIGKRLVLAGGAGLVRSHGDTAYGANLELRLKDEDFPIEQNQSSLGLSLMKWRSDLALTVALQSQFSIGRSSKMAVHVGLNNKRSGQITVRTSSSDQLQIALAGFLPIAVSIFRSFWPGFGAQRSTN